MNENYYETLGIPKDAKEEEIKRAYRNLVRKYHPDNNPNDKEAEIIFRKINEAYVVLSDPQKRKQCDTGDSSIDASAYAKAVFNTLFRDNVERYNKEREDYIRFLDEMEPEFNKYNRTLKNEKAAALKSSWSLLEPFGSFSDRKSKIVKQLNDLRTNIQAFDEFLIFYEETKKEIKQYGFQFYNMDQYAEISQRGVISAEFFSDLKSKIRNTLNTLLRKIEAFDEHMQFLDEMEEKFHQYDKNNKIIKTIKEKLKDQRGKISVNQIYEQQRNIKIKLSELEKRARAFDEFLEYYLATNQEMKTLYGRKLVNCDEYLDPKNRISFSPAVFSDKRQEIKNIISSLSIERSEKVKQLREEIEKRNLNFYAYLAARNTDEFTIPMSDIKTILNSMELIDQINETLAPFGITFEEFLKLKGKLLIDMKNKELLVIKDVIKNYITNAKDVNFIDMDLIDFDKEVIEGMNKN